MFDEENNDSPQSNLKKTNSFISKVSPIHSRTRSSSLEMQQQLLGIIKEIQSQLNLQVVYLSL